MTSSPRPPVGVSGEPGHDGLKEDHVERDLDEALMETFPASDPVSITPEQERPEAAVDEALDASFPASDPAAPTQPGKK